jgi:hypothetical protein
MRRQREQLQAVATSGVVGNVNRTAPQWHEPLCMRISWIRQHDLAGRPAFETPGRCGLND